MEDKVKQITKSTRIILIIAAFIVVISALIKVNHWPGSNYVDLLKSLGFIAGFGAVVYENYKLKKEIKNN